MTTMKQVIAINKAKELSEMKKLIKKRKRRFVNRTYQKGKMKGMTFDQVLLNFYGLSVKEAWNICLSLNISELEVDYSADYNQDGRALIFRRTINNQSAYIKLKIEENEGEEVVCISFHP